MQAAIPLWVEGRRVVPDRVLSSAVGSYRRVFHSNGCEARVQETPEVCTALLRAGLRPAAHHRGGVRVWFPLEPFAQPMLGIPAMDPIGEITMLPSVRHNRGAGSWSRAKTRGPKCMPAVYKHKHGHGTCERFGAASPVRSVPVTEAKWERIPQTPAILLDKPLAPPRRRRASDSD